MQLSFSQKVGLGFGIIVLLLLISGLSSLWNLDDIEEATTEVNETAVPVVKLSNEVQIKLLKLGKMSALAFNATALEKTLEYRKSFNEGVALFKESYLELRAIAEQDELMTQQVGIIKKNYDAYESAVREMFTAKIASLEESAQIDKDAYDLIGTIDEVGATLAEISFFEAPEKYKKDMEDVAGTAGRADDYLISVIKTIEEIKAATDLKQLESLVGAMAFSWNDVKRRMERAGQVFEPFDEQNLFDAYLKMEKVFTEKVNKKPDLVDKKIGQLKQSNLAREQLNVSNEAISISVDGLDKLLKNADEQFEELQGQVVSSLDFGFKSSIAILVVLILLAAQNFNSMRVAIRKKVIDLAQLNTIGRTLAGSQSQVLALEEVLQAMHKKIGVDNGSVYLTNEDHDFEIKACFPPKVIDPTVSPVKFAMGEGILGRAAESKRVIFVANTAKEKSFKHTESDRPQALLCVPLVDKDILVGVINLSGDVKKVTFSESDYSFMASVARSLVTVIKNIRMREVIEEQNRNLEHKVEERTAALKQKNNDIANMMANMHQGLFTITQGGLIHPEYSSYLETIYETKAVANRNFADLMFSNTSLSEDAKDQVITAVGAIVGEDEMMYEFNNHLLRREMTIETGSGKEKILEMEWDPILNEGDCEKLMVTVRDVTELKALEAEAAGQKEELEIIGEILAIDRNKFNEFIDSALRFATACRDIIKRTTEKDADAIAELFRNMHTIKGNARTYGFKIITETTHIVEQTYDELRKDEALEWEQEALEQELSLAFSAIEKYQRVAADKLGDGSDTGNIEIDKDRVGALLEKITRLTGSDVPDNLRGVVSETYNTLIAIEAKPISRVIDDVISSVHSLAKELQKESPNIVIDDNDVFIKSELHSVLNDIFMHVFRNAIDHGIEGGEERTEKGKKTQGSIFLNTVSGPDYVEFHINDDGRGLALTKIFEKGIDLGLYQSKADRPADEEIANLIFSSGFSTAEQVTEVSGRGVGMDAAKGFIVSQGGHIAVVLNSGVEGADFRQFKTVIRIPSQFYIVAPSFAKAV